MKTGWIIDLSFLLLSWYHFGACLADCTPTVISDLSKSRWAHCGRLISMTAVVQAVALFHNIVFFQERLSIWSKSTKLGRHILCRRPLAGGQHHAIPPGFYSRAATIYFRASGGEINSSRGVWSSEYGTSYQLHVRVNAYKLYGSAQSTCMCAISAATQCYIGHGLPGHSSLPNFVGS